MKMRLKMKRRLHRYGPRPRSGPGHKSTKYKVSQYIMVVICIKQYLKVVSAIFLLVCF